MWIEFELSEKEFETIEQYYQALIKSKQCDDISDILGRIVKSYQHVGKPERNTAIFKMRNEGCTLEEIAKKFNITKERVRQIYLREERRKNAYAILKKKEETGYSDFYKCMIDAAKELNINEAMVVKSYKCLLRARIVQELDKDYMALDYYTDSDLLNIRGIGIISVDLIRKANDMFKHLHNEQLISTQ